jgi:hypothetical protein
MKIILEVPTATVEEVEKYKQIFSVLLDKGALDGVKGGQVNIHFDAFGNFQGVEFNYWPWRKVSMELEMERAEKVIRRNGFKLVKES